MALADVEGIITAARSAAQDAQARAASYSDNAQMAAGSIVSSGSLTPIGTPVLPTVVAPSINLKALFDDTKGIDWTKFQGLLDSKLTSFMGQYFPNYEAHFLEVDNWLSNAITVGGTGIKPSVEAAIWARGREREDILNQRAELEISQQFASRGWTLPQGAQLARVDEARQAVVSSQAELSRKVSVEQAQMEQNNVKYAISQQANLGATSMRSVEVYVSQVLRNIAVGIDDANARVAAEREFYNETTQFYTNQRANEETLLEYYRLLGSEELQQKQIDVNQMRDSINAQVQAAVGGAAAMSRVAQAALASQNTMGTISDQTTHSL